MTVSDLKAVIIIESNWVNARKVKKILGKMTQMNIAIIDIWCLNNTKKFIEIKKLLNEDSRLKIFHGGSETIFNDMVRLFSLKDREDVVYISYLQSRAIANLYQEHIFKPFPPSLSSNISAGFTEI